MRAFARFVLSRVLTTQHTDGCLMTGTDDEAAELAALTDEATRILGRGHFATQTFARISLRQAALSGGSPSPWLVADMAACQEYIQRGISALANAVHKDS
jgi:hypothetical protein